MSDDDPHADRIPSPSSIESPPATSLDYEDFEFESQIGTGGSADVWRTRIPDDEQIFAVKRPQLERTLNTDRVEQLQQEAETWARLADHSHIVGVVDYGARPVPWIAMEYMDGGHLGDHVDAIEPPQALWTGERIASSLRHASRHGVAHLDLKPGNVLFTTTPEGLWNAPKVSDWGLARVLIDDPGDIEGFTPRYAAPEQLAPEQFGEPDQFTDIYQLGLLLYELVTGDHPYPDIATRERTDRPPTPPTDVDPSLPDRVDEVLLRALAPEKQDRYRTAVHFQDALKEARTSLAEPTDESTGPSRDIRAPEPDSVGRSWLCFRGDPARSGTQPQATGPTTGVEQQWAFTTAFPVSSSPAVAEGVVYVGGRDESLYAIDAETGTAVWTADVNRPVWASPTVSEGLVYVGSYDGGVYAFDAETGDERWRVDTGAPVHASPAVVDGRVYTGTYDGDVIALAADTGETVWNSEVTAAIRGSPAVSDRSVYVADNGGEVVALDADTGAESWGIATDARTFSSPAVVGGTVYVGSDDGSVRAIDGQDGDTRWTRELGGKVRSSAAVAKGVGYVGWDDGRVYALDGDSGEQQWSYETGGTVRSSPAVVSGVVYVGSDDGRVYALDADTGDPQWGFALDEPVRSSPAVVSGVVYVGCDDGGVYALADRAEG